VLQAQVLQAQKEQQDQLVPLARRELQEQVLQEQPGSTEQQDQLVPLARRELQVKALLDQLVLLARRELQVKALLVLLD
jgi:hypothetical protein